MKKPIRLTELIDAPVPLIVLVKWQILSRRNQDNVNLSWAEDEIAISSWLFCSPTIVANVSNFSLQKN